MNLQTEDNIDFYSILNSEDSDSINETCLISGEPLEDRCIILECGHKYNYYYIFSECFKQKHMSNSYARHKLQYNQIKCPYCRNVQNTILPYRNVENCREKIYGINYPTKYCMKNYSCSYMFRRGAKKGTLCGEKCDSKYCSKHLKYMKSDEEK